MLDLKKYEEPMQKCSRCKFCQASCPVFLEDLLETHVAGARIGLINAALMQGSLPVSDRFKEVVDRCLLCTNCVQTCPPNIPVDEIVVAARHKIYGGKRQNLIKRKLLRQFMDSRGFGSILSRVGALAHDTGLFPPDFPAPAGKPFLSSHSGSYPAEGRRRAKVAYFVGCGTNAFYPDTAEDVIKVMNRNGIEVVIPEGLVCCGLPAMVEGDLETAQELARKNIAILAAQESDAIITDCTSCGRSLKAKFNKLFPDNDPLLLKAAALGDKVWEATDYLNSIGLSAAPGNFPEAFTYHVPCHRGWSQTLREAPRLLLAKVPGAKLIEMEFPEKCCGAGGNFFMAYKELSQKIRAHKIQDIESTGAGIVISQCPSCRSYLSAKLKQKKFMHPLSFLARSYGNE